MTTLIDCLEVDDLAQVREEAVVEAEIGYGLEVAALPREPRRGIEQAETTSKWNHLDYGSSQADLEDC